MPFIIEKIDNPEWCVWNVSARRIQRSFVFMRTCSERVLNECGSLGTSCIGEREACLVHKFSCVSNVVLVKPRPKYDYLSREIT